MQLREGINPERQSTDAAHLHSGGPAGPASLNGMKPS